MNERNLQRNLPNLNWSATTGGLRRIENIKNHVARMAARPGNTEAHKTILETQLQLIETYMDEYSQALSSEQQIKLTKQQQLLQEAAQRHSNLQM
jgi:hypothetical protein